jgi:NADH-quinone oxidoreductase subunit I
MTSLRGFLRRFFLVDILKGLLITLKYYFSRKVTIPYPERVRALPPRFKGLLRLYRDEAGEPLCIACQLCQKICPTHCFDIEGHRVPERKTPKPVRYEWKLFRCSFCGLCTEVCPTSAIRFSREFRMTMLQKNKLLFHLPEMYLEGEELQKYLCEGCLE